MITITDSIDVKQWGEFVYNHPYGNIFQTPEMAEVYKRTKNYEPITLAAIDNTTDEMLAMLLAVVIQESSVMGSLSARSVIHGGPLFTDNEVGVDAVLLLLKRYETVAKQKALFTMARMVHAIPQLSPVLTKVGYEYKNHVNFLADLTEGVDELWKKLYKSKRQAINKAKRIGVSVEEIEDKKLIPVFYNSVEGSYSNSRVPLVDISLFESVFDILAPKNLCKFFLAAYDNQYVASTCFACYKGYIFDWYGGIDRRFSSCRANELLEWYSLKWGAENGFHIFDFGGAGNPDEPYGPRRFKKEFGGRLVDIGRYTKVHSPGKFWAVKKMYGMYRGLRRVQNRGDL